MLSDKKLEKIEKILGPEAVATISGSSSEDLRGSIIRSEQSIKSAQEELEANPKYQEIKENLKALSAGLREIKKAQKAVIDYALHQLEIKGE